MSSQPITIFSSPSQSRSCSSLSNRCQKPDHASFAFTDSTTAGLIIGSSLSNAYATACGGNPKLQVPGSKTQRRVWNNWSLEFGIWYFPRGCVGGVTDGTRTRNSQNHNLELYH